MPYSLTSGAIQSIMDGDQVETPVLQVLGLKKLSGSGGGNDRYRMLLSDGVNSHSSAMLATQLNHKVTSGELDQMAVIRLEKYICNTIQPDNRRVMILLEITLIAQGSTVNEKIGNPQTMRAAGGNRGGGESSHPAQQTAPPSKAETNNAKPDFYSNAGGGGGGVAKKPFVEQNKAVTPNTPGGTPIRVHPINSLTPYQNRWTIKVRVTSKSAVRTWSNSRGEGKLFSMTFLDDSGEIKATAFRDQVDKFYDIIEVNKVYYVKKGTLKTADKRYSSIDNDYEMTFNNDTEITPCDEDSSLPSVSFNFVPIDQLEKREPNSTVDIVGVVKSTQDVSTVISRSTQKELKKRELELVDQSQVIIRMTLWGADAENFDGSSNPVIAFKGVRLSDFGGRSLSTLGSSQIMINPDIPEAHKVRGWYEHEGSRSEFGRFSSEGGSGAGQATNWKTFAEVKSQNLGGDKPEYFTTKATAIFAKKDNCMYMACPQQDCNKKVIDQSNGFYRCEKCQKEYPNYKWRMILQVNLADFSDNQWSMCFQDSAEVILGKSAEELGKLKDGDEAGFEQVFQACNFKSYIFRLRAKMETYNEETRLKVVCVQATPINFQDYNKKLTADIEKMAAS